jgi:hypothetical protein
MSVMAGFLVVGWPTQRFSGPSPSLPEPAPAGRTLGAVRRYDVAQLSIDGGPVPITTATLVVEDNGSWGITGRVQEDYHGPREGMAVVRLANGLGTRVRVGGATSEGGFVRFDGVGGFPTPDDYPR